MRFVAFMIGLILLTAGLAWAAIEAGAPMLYVQIGGLILLGIGLIAAASRTRFGRPSQDVNIIRDDDLV
jgi:hypothetical protein